jgi:ATP-binding cassette subfamily B protein
VSWGPPAGTPFGGAGGAGAGGGAGLPFAGVPPELAERAASVLATEPEHPEPDVPFTHHLADGDPDTEQFTLRSFLRPVAGPVALAIGLVVVETATLQAGPLLTQIGIDRGISVGDFGVVLAMAGLFLAAVALNVVASGVRISYTGRLGERLMEALRIRVFAHLQRLSLDYYTGERSGRVMTRMTSDIDALTALFQDGLVNLAVQGLTLVIITVVLFWMSPMLALITIGVVVPVMLALTLWFRRASERAYGEVRDRIADVLTDLAESLAGIRVIAAHNRRDRNVADHESIVDDHLQANLTTARVGAIYGPASDGVGIAGQAVVLGVGAVMVLNDQLTIGELSAFVLYLTAFFAPVQQLVQLYTTYQSGQAAVTKLRDLLDTEPAVPEDPAAVDLPPVRGAISLRGVTFGFAPDRAARRAPGGGTRGDPGAGGADRGGQVHRGQAHRPLLRPRPRHRRHRRPRPPPRHARLAALPTRRRTPGAVPVPRHRARQPLLRRPRSHRRRVARGMHPAGHGRPRGPAPRRTRHPGA